MTQNVVLADGDVAVEPFFDATQEMLSGLAVNFEVTLANSTTIQVVAGTGHAQVSVAIGGKYRFITATITRVHPGGSAGTYDVYVTAVANQAGTQAPASNNYAFALAIVASGGTPAGVDIYRLMRRVVWSGTAITAIQRLEVEGPGGPAGGELAGSYPSPTIGALAAGRVLTWGGDTSLQRTAAGRLGVAGLDLTGSLALPTVAALPGSPYHGQVILFQSTGMAAKGIVYMLRYRAFQADGVTANPNTYKWEFAGGGGWYDRFASTYTVFGSGSTPIDLSTALLFTAPLAGEYEAIFRGRLYPGSGFSAQEAFALPMGSETFNRDEALNGVWAAANPVQSNFPYSGFKLCTVSAAGGTIRFQGAAPGSPNWIIENVAWEIRPVRLG